MSLVLGSELESSDLEFAGLRCARTCVIFSPPVMNKSERQTADCQTVLTAMRVRHLAPKVFAIVGMHEGSNARFFRLTRLTNPSQLKALASLIQTGARTLKRQVSKAAQNLPLRRDSKLGLSGLKGDEGGQVACRGNLLKDAAARVETARRSREREQAEAEGAFEVQARPLRDQRGSMATQDVDFNGGREHRLYSTRGLDAMCRCSRFCDDDDDDDGDDAPPVIDASRCSAPRTRRVLDPDVGRPAAHAELDAQRGPQVGRSASQPRLRLRPRVHAFTPR